MTTPRRTRRLSAALLALSVTAALGPLATSPASAAADRPSITFGPVSASSEATPDGTVVSTVFEVENRSERRRPARSVYLSLVAVDRDPGPGRAYRLDTLRLPATAPDGVQAVLSEVIAPRAVVAGDYHVRVCTTPRSSTGSCRLTPDPSVTIGEADVVMDQSDIDGGDVAPGEVSEPVDVVVSNTGQSRTNRIRLAVQGGDHPGDFDVEDGTCTTWLAAGESCTAQVVFAPPSDATGIRSSGLIAGGRGRGGAVGAGLVGTAVPQAVLTIEPGEFSYGSVAPGGQVSQTFELVNSSDTDEPLTVGNLTDYTAFIFDYVDGQNTCLSTVIPANGSCTFSVAFVPPAPGDYSTTAVFGGPRGHATAELSGTGAGIEPVRAPASRAPGAGDYLR